MSMPSSQPTSQPKSIPIAIIGKGAVIAAAVIEALKPDYEVIHLCLEEAAGLSELPLLFQITPDSKPSISSSSGEGLDTRNYTAPPTALITGGLIDDELVRRLREACDVENAPVRVPWLRPDLTKTAMAGIPFGPEYGLAVGKRMKEFLNELKEKGEMGKDGVVWY